MQDCYGLMTVAAIQAFVPPPVHLAGRITNPEAYELEGRVFESQSLRSVSRIPGVK